VELYDGSDPNFPVTFVSRFEGAFGRHCSGTMIGPDMFVTANHSSCPVAVGESVGFNCQLSASDPTPPDPDAAATARCEWFVATEVVQYPDVDVSVSRLAGAPGSKYGFVLPSPRPLTTGDPIAVFQHPAGQGRRKIVGFGTVNSATSDDIGYRIDTTGGSSGGGVLDRSGLLVAVHRSSGCSETGGQNHGTPMSAIFDVVPEIRQPVVAVWSSIL
jgi:hypothetical protein